MSLQHTPPKSSQKLDITSDLKVTEKCNRELLLNLNTPVTQHYQSVPNLNEIAECEIACRLKRKREDPECETFNSKMLSAFKELKEEQRTSFSLLRTTMEEIREQNEKLQESVIFCSAKYDEAMEKIKMLETEKIQSLKYVNSLESRIDFLERQTRLTSIEIRNLPGKTTETKQDLSKLITDVGKSLDVPIQTLDLKDVFRVNTGKSTIKPIIAEFTTAIKKDEVLLSVKQYNKDNPKDKLNTQVLKIEGPKLPVYITENLPPKTKKLFFMAREAARLNNFKYCWVSSGRVLMRRKEGDTLLRIESEASLANLGSEEK